MLTLHINVDGLERKLKTLADRASDLNKPLRRFGGYLKSKAQEKYKAQDFDPLAQSTIEKRTQKGLRKVERRLGRQLKTALQGPNVKVKTQERRRAVVAEFEKNYRHTQSFIGPHLPLSLKQMVGLGNRVDKAVAKAVGAPILGKLGSSLKVMVTNGSVTLTSRTKEGWSEVHNEGDSHVPKRETIRLESDDLDVLIQILKEHLLMDLEEDA